MSTRSPLGHESGNTDGEASVQTAVGISKVQAEHNLGVTGEASPQLAGVIKAAIDRQHASGRSGRGDSAA